MLTTDFALGTPCWIDLGVPDINATSAFYAAVFDWEVSSGGPDSGYAMFTKDAKVVAAIGQLSEEGARPAWMIYFRTSDAQATADQVRQAGGTVRVSPMDVDGHGRLAQFTDPQGGQFAVWEPRENPGLGAVDEPDSLSWVELMTTDAAAAKRFYGQLFGWSTSDAELPGGGGTYSMIIPSGHSEDRMFGGIVELSASDLVDGRPYWHPVFAVADCDRTVGRATAHGGSVSMGPEDVAGVGRLAVLQDPVGAEFVVLTPASA